MNFSYRSLHKKLKNNFYNSARFLRSSSIELKIILERLFYIVNDLLTCCTFYETANNFIPSLITFIQSSFTA